MIVDDPQFSVPAGSRGGGAAHQADGGRRKPESGGGEKLIWRKLSGRANFPGLATLRCFPAHRAGGILRCMNKLRNIMRVDRTQSGGYLVRITRRGKLHSEYFSDSTHGGKRKALKAAQEYRDAQEQKLKAFTAKQLSKKLRANNTSGTPGVRLVTETDSRWASEPTYQYYVAQWSPAKGVRKTKRFSVKKYGKKKALEMAIKARNRGVNQMEQ